MNMSPVTVIGANSLGTMGDRPHGQKVVGRSPKSPHRNFVISSFLKQSNESVFVDIVGVLSPFVHSQNVQ